MISVICTDEDGTYYRGRFEGFQDPSNKGQVCGRRVTGPFYKSGKAFRKGAWLPYIFALWSFDNSNKKVWEV